jgi:CheY-like chemotaxis protein/DNA-directed RNA polymerase specialized sigma24 family protein
MSATDREVLVRALPYARRFARALTGSQEAGDGLVAAALRGLLASSHAPDTDATARTELYGAIGRLHLEREPHREGDRLNPMQRLLLLLTALEEQPVPAAAAALGIAEATAARELASAREKLRAGSAARVLIIEDEPIIAMDLQLLVEGCGHEVVGIAASEDEAVAIADAERPSLVLADINLGPGGDGTSAVARILRRHKAPVIFVTAYPERLLTGEAVEPAFVITKPFEPTTLAVATYQAVTRGVQLD